MRLTLLKKTAGQWGIASFRPQVLAIRLRYRLAGRFVSPPSLLPAAIMPGIAPADDDFKHLSFTFAVIALSAHVARNDGPVSREAYAAFREAFPLTDGICGKIRRLFLLACQDTTPCSHYVAQVKFIFPGQAPLFASLLERLFRIAAADGRLSPAKDALLAQIAQQLDIPAAEYTSIRSFHVYDNSPHQVLGVEKHVSLPTLKRRYRELMRLYHPDRFAAERLSPEVELLLKLKAAEVNAAYRRLTRRAA